MDDKKNKLMVNVGMCLIVGGTMYTSFNLENFIPPIAGIISCGVCLVVCGFISMISQNK